MEYFLGSFVTLATLYVALKFFGKKMPKTKNIIRYTQAYKYENVKEVFRRMVAPKPPIKTQSTKHLSKISTRVLFLQNDAYWIKDNAVYTAKLIDGKVDEESTRTVDTMGMDKVQLDKMIFIVSKLTEGIEDDRSSTGN